MTKSDAGVDPKLLEILVCPLTKGYHLYEGKMPLRFLHRTNFV